MIKLLTAALFFLWASALFGAEYKFTTVTMPDAKHTTSFGINDHGDIVGVFSDCDTCLLQAFIFTDGQYFEIPVAGAKRVYPMGINRDGVIVGLLDNKAFVMDQQTTTILDKANRADAINNRGIVVGDQMAAIPGAAGLLQMAYRWRVGEYALLVTPTEVPGILGSSATGINGRGDTVGYYFFQLPDLSFKTQGFLRKGDKISPVDILPLGINREGTIVGLSGPGNDGAIMENGAVTLLKVPGADHTTVRGINNNGVIVGYYLKAGVSYGFYAEPISPKREARAGARK